MAEHGGGYEVNTVVPMDYKEHVKTYSLFIQLIKYGMAVVVVILLFMVFFLL